MSGIKGTPETQSCRLRKLKSRNAHTAVTERASKENSAEPDHTSNYEARIVQASPISDQTNPTVSYELRWTRPSNLETVYEPRDISGPISDIVFVHGLNGHPRASWSWCGFDGIATTFWPAAFLSRDVPRSRILTYGYDTERKNTWRNTVVATLQLAAQFLLSHLVALRGHSNSVRICPLPASLFCHRFILASLTCSGILGKEKYPFYYS